MVKKEILKLGLEKGILLDKETLNFLSEFDLETAKDFIEKIANLKERVITKSVISRNVNKIKELLDNKTLVEKLKINLGITLEIERETSIKANDKKIKEDKKEESDVKVIFSVPNQTKKIEVDDFVNYFRNRYLEIKSFLQGRKELQNLSSIGKISKSRQAISIIGMVLDKRITKNKNIFLEVEDLSGKLNVLINKDKKELYEKAKDVLVDDILGIKGFGDNQILFANDIIYPECYLGEKHSLNVDANLLFLSDMHIGSKNFKRKEFEKFIKWVNCEEGNEEQKKEARKVKYILIVGDLVDGVGVYPSQYDELEIKDIRGQYEEVAKYLRKIRKDIKIIIIPGNHDAVRVAEPQPLIDPRYGEPLHNLENVTLVSNPAMIDINDGKNSIKILMYHGSGMNSFANEIESLRMKEPYSRPAKIVIEALKRRHLASMHSSVTYIPTERDFLLIKEVPDIITVGEFHHTDIDIYNNILVVCNSCWQSITPFQEKLGHKPETCKIPLFNLKTRQIKLLDFEV